MRLFLDLLFGLVAWCWLKVGPRLERWLFADDPSPTLSLLDRRDRLSTPPRDR